MTDGRPENVPGGGPEAAGDGQSLGALCARAMAGDHGAFEQIHRRVGAGLRRVLLSRSGGREDLVDDLTQRTWASVWRALREGKYDPSRAAITTFVYAVANNAWLTHLRGFAREQGYTGGPATLGDARLDRAGPPSDGADAEALGQAEVLEAVRACLRDDNPAGLAGHEREILIAVAGGETDRGIAQRLRISASTVNVRKHAGYAKIRRYLAERGLAAEETEGADAGRAADGPAAERGSAGGAGGGAEDLGTYRRALTAHHDGATP